MNKAASDRADDVPGPGLGTAPAGVERVCPVPYVCDGEEIVSDTDVSHGSRLVRITLAGDPGSQVRVASAGS